MRTAAPALRLPELVAHADWGSSPSKRWLAVARLGAGGEYRADAPAPVEDPRRLLKDLHAAAGGGAALLGFDFPIGLPIFYAHRAGIASFLALLPELGRPGGAWADFFCPAERPQEISLRRPFYPLRPGGTRQADLLAALGAAHMDDLRRRCERAHAGRRAAAPLFWTLGGQQVGKAAAHGWSAVLIPALRRGWPPLALWPFSGGLEKLLHPGRVVVAETYPAEYYQHLGLRFSAPRRGERSGKRIPRERAANAGAILAWAEAHAVRLAPGLAALIRGGFGERPGGDDPFDACVGLLGMLGVLRAPGAPAIPSDPAVRQVEGWILGQPPGDQGGQML